MTFKRSLLIALPLAIGASLWPLSDFINAEEPIRVAEKIETGQKPLMLNGSATRTVFGFKVYQVSLYLTAPKSSEHEIYAERDPKRIHIEMLRDVSGAKFESTIKKNIDANFTAVEKTQYASGLKAFLAALVEGVEFTKGTNISIDFVPSKGTHVSIDGGIAKVIPGDDFYHALLRLWIGDPLQESVKQGLLSKRDAREAGASKS